MPSPTPINFVLKNFKVGFHSMDVKKDVMPFSFPFLNKVGLHFEGDGNVYGSCWF